jgi:hypothetical protein
MRNALRRTIVAVVLAPLHPVSVFAQATPRAPAGVVFGAGGPANPTERQPLNLTIDVNEAYDQNVTVRSGDAAFSLFQTNGFYTMITPSVDFASLGERVQFAVNAGSNARYYSDLHETIIANHSLGAGLKARVSSKTSVSVNEGVTYAPALFYGLFASAPTATLGEVVPPASNYLVNDIRSYASNTQASIAQQLSQHGTLSFTSNLRFTDFTGHNASYPDVHTAEAGGRYNYSLSRGVALRLGYVFRRAEFAGSPRSTEHNFDVGFDLSRALSPTRKATLSFSVGPTVATAPLFVGSQELVRQYRLVADASLKYELGRTWVLEGNYHRGFGYIQGLQSPVYTEAYQASTSGYLSRRLDLTVSAAYSTGEAALTGAAAEFATYTGNLRMRYAVSRMWAVYGEYLLYYYDFTHLLSPLPPGVPPGLTRNGARAGVMLWIPVRRR